jgi:hypothetical protein
LGKAKSLEPVFVTVLKSKTHMLSKCIIYLPIGSEPEMVKPEMVEPEMVKPEMVKPEMVEPERVEPDMVEPEMVKPEMVEPEIFKPGMDKLETANTGNGQNQKLPAAAPEPGHHRQRTGSSSDRS